MRFIQAVPPKGWIVITRHRLYIVCEKAEEPEGGEQLVQKQRVA
jgi:hypothetical protein